MTVATTIENNFEEQYVQLRQKEKRIYSDEEVALLPDTFSTNAYNAEWSIRKQSSYRLVSYLAKKKKPLKILEAGCGNGWLSHQLSKITNSIVVGLDVNSTELNQAKRVFANVPNLKFVHANLLSILSEQEKFDVIVFAASVQYFSPLYEIISCALGKLHPGGEIHITDSCFYSKQEVSKAKERTRKYFAETGNEEMTHYYFHHCLEDLNDLNYTLLYNPANLITKISGNRNPFQWVRIKATA